MIVTQKGLKKKKVYPFKEIFSSKKAQNKTCKKNTLQDLIT